MAYIRKGKRDPAERLRSKLIENKGTECWEYQGHITAEGYGSFSVDGKPSLAHRTAYLLFTGRAIAVDEVIRHLCHNKICCNPAHLAVGTRTDNAQDSVAVGAIRNGMQRLTKEDYEGIFASKLTHRETAKLFGTTMKHVQKIRLGGIKIANDPTRWDNNRWSIRCKKST